MRIDAREDTYLPEFGSVRDKVRVEYLAVARREADAALYADLKARYRIEIADIGASEGSRE